MKKRSSRILASTGAIFSALFTFMQWASIGFQERYFPQQSLMPIYLTIALFALMTFYFGMVAVFSAWRPKHWFYKINERQYSM